MKKFLKKENLIKFIFVFLLSLTMCFFVFSNKLFDGHDTEFHMYRLAGIIDALYDHQFLPKVYPSPNNGYGYGEALFYCDLFYYPFAFLYLLGVPIVVCFKALKASFIILAIITAFYSSSIIFKKNKLAPYIFTMLYSFCNYHLYDLYLRDAMGEVFAIAFIPLVMLAIYYILIEHKNKWVLLGLSYSFLLYSHVMTFAIYCGLFALFSILFVIYNRKNKELLKETALTILKGVILAILLASFYLFPLIEQLLSQTFRASYYGVWYDIGHGASVKEMLTKIFVSLFNYRSSLDNDSCIFNLGIVFYFVQFLYLFLLLKKKSNKSITVLFIISNIFIFFSFGLVKFKGIFQFANTLQFAFRFNIISFPPLSYVITYSLININKKLTTIVFILISIYSLTNMKLIIEQSETSNYYYYNNQKTEEVFSNLRLDKEAYDMKIVSQGEYFPYSDVYQYYWPDALTIKVVDENRYDYYDLCVDGEPISYTKNGTRIEFTYEACENNIIMLPLTYYKGYKMYAIGEDGEKIRLEYEDIGRYKQVAFRALIGNYDYVCHYDGTVIQYVSLIVSIISYTIFIIFIVRKRIN